MEKLKKPFEHIFYFLLTTLLTYLIVLIPYVRDTHRFVKSELEIYRTYYRINNSQEIIYEIFNKGSLSLGMENTIIEYKSNQLPVKALIFDENGNTETIIIKGKIPEPFRLNYPDWLKSRDNISLKIIYDNPLELNDELRLRYSKDGKFSTITSSKDNAFSKIVFKSKLKYLIWTINVLIYILILIAIYWVKRMIPRIKDWYYKQLEERFISKETKFLKDGDKN